MYNQTHYLTYYPFILNGVNLAGVGSAGMNMTRRLAIWKLLEEDWNIKDKFPAIAKEVKLEELNTSCIDAMLEGRNMGRILLKH